MKAFENVVRQWSIEIVGHGVHTVVDAQVADLPGTERHELCHGFAPTGDLDLLPVVDEPQQL
jgi:hypothetical protein